METHEILKRLRESKGLTMKEVSDATKMATSLISDYETGKKALGMKVAIRLADFYNVSLDYLVGREPAPQPPPELSAKMDDKEFLQLYNSLPEFAKQIFVDAMTKLSQGMEQYKQIEDETS